MKAPSTLKTVHQHAPALIQAWRQIIKSPGPSDTLLTREFRLCVSKVIELSAFHKDAVNFSTLWSKSPLLGAFMTYFWPIYYQEAQYLFRQQNKPLGRVLDLGCAAGPFTIAALENKATDVWALDSNERCLMVLSEFAARLGHTLTVRQWNPLKPWPVEGSFDTIIAGHSLLPLAACNPEQAYKIIKQAISLLAPGGRILIIEQEDPKRKKALGTLFKMIQEQEQLLSLRPLKPIEGYSLPLERTQLMHDIMRSAKRQELKRTLSLLSIEKPAL